MLVACLAMTALAGCAASNDAIKHIPGPPAYAVAVNVPDPKPDEQCLPVALRERAGRLKANRVIRAVRGDWKLMQTIYGQGAKR